MSFSGKAFGTERKTRPVCAGVNSDVKSRYNNYISTPPDGKSGMKLH